MLSQLDKLTPEAVKVLEPYAGKLLEADRANIISLAVYGSATGSNFLPGKSNVNLAVVVSTLMLEQLKLYQTLTKKKQMVVPLFLTQEHVESSLDVFPMELLEIKDNHITIFGKEIFDELKVELSHLRLQCEREIKSRLIRLRQAYPEIGSKAKGLAALLVESFNSILPIMRTLMYLGDQEHTPEVAKDQILSQLSAKFEIEDKVFRRVLELKTMKKPPPILELESIFDQYLQQLQRLAQLVDQIK
jgi:hypothetical protein